MGRSNSRYRPTAVSAGFVSGAMMTHTLRQRTFLTDIAWGRALSRSGKKILHVDKNDHYGGAEAALSLQEIDAWVAKVNDGSRANRFL